MSNKPIEVFVITEPNSNSYFFTAYIYDSQLNLLNSFKYYMNSLARVSNSTNFCDECYFAVIYETIDLTSNRIKSKWKVQKQLIDDTIKYGEFKTEDRDNVLCHHVLENSEKTLEEYKWNEIQ